VGDADEVKKAAASLLISSRPTMVKTRRKKLPEGIRDYFVEMGRIGGKKGVKNRMAKLSPERRREIAQKAIAARWAKRDEALRHGRSV